MQLRIFIIVSLCVCLRCEYAVCLARWMHVPKTSSTFCITLQRLCHGEIFWQSMAENSNPLIRAYRGCMHVVGIPFRSFNRWHAGCGSNITSNYYTILRHPKSRTISAYMDFLHTEGMSPRRIREMYQALNMSASPGVKSRLPHQYSLEENIERYKTYSTFPDNVGCMVKMLNGYYCNGYKNSTDEMLTEAIRRLHDFRFVGLFEEYTLSLKLLYKMENMTNQEIHAIESTRFRSRNDTSAIRSALNAVGYEDKHDSALHEAAKEIFYRRVKAYGLA